MALPRYSSIFQGLLARQNPATAPGTKGAAFNDWKKSPILGGLPTTPFSSLYNKGLGEPLKLYQSKNPISMSDLAKTIHQGPASLPNPSYVQQPEVSAQPFNPAMAGMLAKSKLNPGQPNPALDAIRGKAYTGGNMRPTASGGWAPLPGTGGTPMPVGQIGTAFQGPTSLGAAAIQGGALTGNKFFKPVE